MIRAFREEDADAVAALLGEDRIAEGVTGDGIRHWLASQPERARAGAWTADEEGRVAGWVRARLRWATSAEGVGEVWAFVAPTARGRGIGAALYEVANAHLRTAGARVVESWTTSEEGRRFLRARGFGETRRQEVLQLDVATADLSGLNELRAARKAEGYELVPLATVADRPDELHRLDAAATAEVPTTYAEDDVRLADWLAEALGHPQLSREGSFVVLAAQTPVAYAFLHVDPASRTAANEMTGTHPDHRRRGLARLAKLASIAWAGEHGYQAIRTHNDDENAGIRRLNRSLGYRRVGTETQYLLEELR